MHEFVWSEGKLERCRTQWAAGVSASKIATELGTTRNAVLGKVWRHKWPGGTPKVKSVKAEKTITKAHRKARKLPPPPEMPVEVSAYQSFAPNGAKTLLQLEASDCRFVLGDRDYTYCGAEVAPDFSYCPVHARLIYKSRADV